MPEQSLGFAEWFVPLLLHDFRSNVLGRRALLVHPQPELAARLVETIGVRSIDDVFTLSASKVYAWFQKLNGQHVAALVSRATARKLHAGGTTIYFRRIREFRAYEREIADALGVPRVGAQCALFCNRPDAVTRAHFDIADIVIIQLRGRKIWRVAPNAFAPMPLERWATLDRVWPRLRLYAPDLPPQRMPGDAVTYDLEPGSVLHVPRGYWHETSSDQDSLSLHIEVSAPSRLDFMMAALKNELSRDPWWREPAYDLSAGDPSAFEHVAIARDRVRETALRLDPRDLVRVAARKEPNPNETRFVRCGQTAFAMESANPEQDTARVSITSYDFRETKITHMEISLAFVSTCKWINELQTGTAFDIADLLRVTPSLTAVEARDLLGALEQADLVRRHGDARD